LVVDDNATNRRVLTGMLRLWGARPTDVDGGPAAIQEIRRAAAEHEAYPLLLTDAMMPDMDGFMLVEELNKEPGLAPHTIMMLTSADRQTDAARCRRLGMAAYLVKPVRADELQIAILAALSGVSRDQRGGARAKSEATRAAANAPAAKLRILLAEDNPVNQRVAIHILQKAGHSVLPVGNGCQALEALAREPFDLVLMDVQMPEMDGFEATNAIRTQEKITGRHQPIVAMTAHAMKGDRERCLEGGMDDYVSKPVRADELLRALQKLAPCPGVEAVVLPPPAPPTDTTQTPTFDRQIAQDRFHGEEELLEEVLQLFLSDAPNRLAALRAGLEQSDPKRVEVAAHSLKGAAGYVGAEQVAARAFKLEELGRSGELSRALNEFRQLEHEIGRFRQAVADLAPATQTT
jgi:CheY-like chemotaxis protein/HPt (histidine-containing phosphotransfer) domain-containing protein